MLFATFQPKEVVDILKSEGEYKVTKFHPSSNCKGVGNESILYRKGYKPIFAVPLKDKRDFLARMFFLYPSCPQRLIIFKSNEFDTLGYVKWLQLLSHRDSLIYNKKCKREMSELELDFNYKNIFNDYIVPSISMKNVKSIHEITDNDVTTRFFNNARTCSDDMMDFLYSNKMDKILKKIFPKDNCKVVDPATVSESTAMELINLLKYTHENTDALTDKIMFEIYSSIKKNYIKG